MRKQYEYKYLKEWAMPKGELTMNRPDKLQIARDEIRENIDLLAVSFIDGERDILERIIEEIEDIIEEQEKPENETN